MNYSKKDMLIDIIITTSDLIDETIQKNLSLEAKLLTLKEKLLSLGDNLVDSSGGDL